MTSERDRAEHALTKLVEDVRRQSTAEIDWETVEASLMKRVQKGASVATPLSNRAGPRWAIAVAALVALTGGVLVATTRHAAPTNTTPTPPAVAAGTTNGATVDGDALTTGSRIVAGTDAVVVTHRGHAVWTLDPNSAAHVESVGAVVAIALDRGALAARVTKSPLPESFVVRVEHTRVAVHGTAFRVERRDDTTVITVAEGVVGVGPIGKAPFELPAPSSATVTFDGIRTDVPATESGSYANPPAKERPKGIATNRLEPVQGMSGGNAAGNIDRVESSVRRCFAELTVSRGDLRVTVSTHMSLHVDPSGKISEASFDPPLVPAVRECVDGELRQIAFPKSAEAVSVVRVLELER